jgi:hypothetical protein
MAASVLHKELQHAPSSKQLTESANRNPVESNQAWTTTDGGEQPSLDNHRKKKKNNDHLGLDSGALLIETPVVFPNPYVKFTRASTGAYVTLVESISSGRKTPES